MTTEDGKKIEDKGWTIDRQTSILHPLSSIFSRWSPASLLGLLQIVGQRLWNHLALMLAIAAGFVIVLMAMLLWRWRRSRAARA